MDTLWHSCFVDLVSDYLDNVKAVPNRSLAKLVKLVTATLRNISPIKHDLLFSFLFRR